MSLVALCTPPGSSGSTTTALLAAAMAPDGFGVLAAECDSSGGDVAAWAQLSSSPGWATAVAGSDRSWSGLLGHAQALPSGLRVLLAPSRSAEAATAVAESARMFAGLLASMPDVVAFADCGRIVDAVPMWAARSQLALLLLRQVPQSAPATVAVVDRGLEALELLRGVCPKVGIVLVGAAPYPVREIETALGVPLFASLPDDRAGAALVAGGWTIGRRASRSPLARSAAELAARAVGSLPATVVSPPVPVTDAAHDDDLRDPLRVIP